MQTIVSLFRVFAVKPSKGILKSGYQVFTVRMTPKTVNTFTHDLLMRLNDNDKYDQVKKYINTFVLCPIQRI